MNIRFLKSTSVLFALFAIGCANNSQIKSQNNTTPKSCLSTYQYYSSKNICDVYWDNKNPQCDNDLKILLRDRGQSVTPRSICGQPIKNSNPPSCNLANISQLTPTNLCNTYYSTSNCNPEITVELIKRNLKLAPKDICGTSINTNSSIKVIKLTSENKQCQTYLNDIFLMTDPLKAACIERYKSVRDETIICRQELNTFISANSNGVGKNFDSCGTSITPTLLLNNEVKINSYRDITSFKSYSIQQVQNTNYIAQFNESKRNLCNRLNENNDFDGTYCLYILDRDKKNFDSANKHLIKSIQLAHPLAFMRAYQLFKDTKNPKEKEDIVKLLSQSAQLGNISAAITISWIYIDQNPKNYEKGLFWSEYAANAGHGEAASNIGLIYHKGLGTKVNLELAKYWYQKSLTMDRYWSGQSHVGLGLMYMSGAGFSRDLKEARKYFKFVAVEMPDASDENINQAKTYLKKLGN
jgi:TPR repeat protein